VLARAVMVVSDLALVLVALVLDLLTGAGVLASVFRRERRVAPEPLPIATVVARQRRSA
jgi:hypothetical protein